MRVAIVHDFIVQFGGAEKVLLNMIDLYPNADVYTLVFDKEKNGIFFSKVKNIIVSKKLQKYYNFLKKINITSKNPQKFLLFFDIIKHIEQFDLSNYDVVISNNSLFAKCVITKPQTLHICYMNTGPSRLLWDEHFEYLDQVKLKYLWPIQNIYLKLKLKTWRLKDFLCAQRPDFLIANSKTVQKKIYKYYKLYSDVIYPPVDIPNYDLNKNIFNKKNNYYLIVSRLVPSKKVDLVIKAFNRTNFKLVIVGEGEHIDYLKKIANKNIQFTGKLTGEKLHEYYMNCKGFIFPQDEDFGITAVEAMSYGKPVLAFRKGGALETVLEGITGEFFDQQTENSLIASLIIMDNKKYDPYNCIKRAQLFSSDNFKQNLSNYINDKIIKINKYI